MIHRLHDLPSRAPLQADVCIIGSGAAGLALASEFLGTRWRVVVLESGDMQRTDAADAMNITHSTGIPHTGGSEGRARVFGGTTTAWGGQLIPLRDSELRARPWVPHSGWPLTSEDLAPFYRRAERLLGVEGPPYDGTTWDTLGMHSPAFDDKLIISRFSQWAPLTRRNLAVLLRKSLESSHNIDVLLGATLTKIVPNVRRNWVEQLEVHGI